MRSTRRTTQLADRRRRVAEAYLRGVPQYKIAEAEGVHNGQISRDLVAIREEWKTAASLAFGERVAKELAKLDELERIYWDAWLRSKLETGQPGRPNDPSAPAKDAERTDSVIGAEHAVGAEHAGDPRFLGGVESCIDKRCRILGLYKQRVEHTGGVSLGMLVVEVEKDGFSSGGDNEGALLPGPTHSAPGCSGKAISVVRDGSAA